jgi:hypothetical protein
VPSFYGYSFRNAPPTYWDSFCYDDIAVLN